MLRGGSELVPTWLRPAEPAFRSFSAENVIAAGLGTKVGLFNAHSRAKSSDRTGDELVTGLLRRGDIQVRPL